jgi:hypothetical protein
MPDDGCHASGESVGVSEARRQTAASLLATYKNLREQLVQNGVFALFDDNSYQFAQDYAFAAPTPAAQVVSGYGVSGNVAWKSESDNTTFGEWRQSSSQQGEAKPS